MNWRELEGDGVLRSLLERRALFLSSVRDFFGSRGFLEVETPYLQRHPNLDPNVHPLKAGDFFLHTSPEYGMKRLLAAGFERIYQICRVFRREIVDDLHLPEFTMVEWYGKDEDYRWLMELSLDLLGYLARSFSVDGFCYRGRRATLDGYRVFSFEDAFVERFGVSIKEVLEVDAIVELARSSGVPCDEESWENTFNLIYLNIFEPEVADSPVPVFLLDYPACMAAMARLRDDKPWLSERVELVVCGVELMNGYSELDDPHELRRRLEAEATKRGMDPSEAVDEDFLEAVPLMGKAAGAALGLDRLFMLLVGEESLGRVVFGW